MVAVAGLLAALVWTVAQQGRVNRELCESTVQNRAADRVQWTTLEHLLAGSTGDPDRRAAFHALIAGVLRPIPPLECVDDKPVPKREG